MNQDTALYYTAPTDEIFNNLKQEAIKLWQTYDNEFGYADEKVGMIKDIKNVKDNFMYMFAMFDWKNQEKIINEVSAETKKAIEDRLPQDFLNQQLKMAELLGL